MAMKVLRTCDHCNNEIKESYGRIDLYDWPRESEHLSSNSFPVKEKHFCTTHCLRGYVNNSYTNSAPQLPDNTTFTVNHS